MDIYVGNLPYSAGDNELRELFEQHGTVSSARVITDRDTGRSKGFGFVDIPDQGEAEKACTALNDEDFMGRNLRVNEAQPKEGRSGGGGGRSGGGGGRGRGGGGNRW